MVNAIIFDADGTLFDTKAIIFDAYIHTAKTHNLKLPLWDEISVNLGNPLLDIYKKLYPNEDSSSLVAENNRFIANNLSNISLMPGILELLNELRRIGLTLGIVSGGNKMILRILEYHGILKYFTSIVYDGRTVKPKPHPEGYFLCCHECGIHPKQTMMVGDSLDDITVANTANAFGTIIIDPDHSNSYKVDKLKRVFVVENTSSVLDTIKSIRTNG